MKLRGIGSVLLIPVMFCCTSFAAALRGKVEGPRGLVAKAEIQLLQNGEQLQVTHSDPAGSFVLENIPPGTYRLQVVASPYLPVIKEVAIAAGQQDTELTITLASLNETVTVTAGRVPIPVVTSVSEVKILSDAELRAMPYQALDDGLRSFPEFSLFRRSSSLVAHPTTQGVSLRGIGPSGVSRSLVLVDGVPLNDAFGGWVYWDRVPLLSLQQVEVANGGGSSLYGNYGLGGVVQLLRRIPERATIEFKGQGGNRGTRNGDIYASHRLGGWGFSTAGSFFDFDGYPVVAASQRGRVDTAASSRHQAARLYAERAPTGSTWMWSLDGGFLNDRRNNGTPLQINRTVAYDFSLGTRWSPSLNDRFEVRTFFRRSIFGSNFTTVATDRNSERLILQQHVPSADGGASLAWYETRGRHRIASGVDFWQVAGQSADSVFAANRVSQIRLGGGEQVTAGFFAEENYAISVRAAFVVGGRLDIWKNFDGMQGSVAPDAPRQVPSLPSDTKVVFSPRVGLTYEMNSAWSLFGSFYRSFRAPTLNELYRGFSVGNVVTNPNRTLVPEHSTGGEYGLRFRAAETVRLSATGFLSLLEDPVSNVTQQILPTQIIRRRQNLGQVRIYGIQTMAAWNPRASVQLEAHYLWDRSTVSKFAADSALVGKRLPQVPQHRVTLKADVAIPRIALFSVTGRFVGDQCDDDLNQITLDRFFQLDANLSRRLSKFTELFLALENATDSKILTSRSPVEFVGTPFQIRAGIHLRLPDSGR